MANFEAFRWSILLSTNLIFLKSVISLQEGGHSTCYRYGSNDPKIGSYIRRTGIIFHYFNVVEMVDRGRSQLIFNLEANESLAILKPNYRKNYTYILQSLQLTQYLGNYVVSMHFVKYPTIFVRFSCKNHENKSNVKLWSKQNTHENFWWFIQKLKLLLLQC